MTTKQIQYLKDFKKNKLATCGKSTDFEIQELVADLKSLNIISEQKNSRTLEITDKISFDKLIDLKSLSEFEKWYLNKDKIPNQKESNYKNINENQTEFEYTIDEILSRLQKLGYGQQIIFDEIEELKILHNQLNKKNLGKALKGKLIDLALSKIIDNDTVSYIYNKITKETLMLP